MTLSYVWAKLLTKMRGSAVRASTIHPTSKVEPGSLVVGSTFDRHSFCGYNCTILNAHIGGFCSIASGVTIGGAHHPIHFVSTSPVFLSHADSVKTKFSRHVYLPVEITEVGHDVWIGERVLIKAGVRIGHGAVIGMGSVVTKDVEPYAIVGGNPARVIRKRFDEATIQALLDSTWWDYTDEQLRAAAPMFNDVPAFLGSLRRR